MSNLMSTEMHLWPQDPLPTPLGTEKSGFDFPSGMVTPIELEPTPGNVCLSELVRVDL